MAKGLERRFRGKARAVPARFFSGVDLLGAAGHTGQAGALQQRVKVAQVGHHLLGAPGVPEGGQRVVEDGGVVLRRVNPVGRAGAACWLHGRQGRLHGLGAGSGLLAVHHGHVARAHVDEARAVFQRQIDAVQARWQPGKGQVIAPADLGRAQIGAGRRHVLPHEARGHAGGKAPVQIHAHPGRAAGRVRPAADGQQAVRGGVQMLPVVRQRLAADVARRRLHVVKRGKGRAAQPGVQRPDVARKAPRQPARKALARSGAVVGNHIVAARAHAGLEIGVEVMHFAQQVDARNARARRRRHLAQGVRQRADGLLAPAGDGVVGAGNAPRIQRPAHVAVRRQRAGGRGGHVVGVLRQRGLDGRFFGKVGGKEIQHHRARHAFNRARNAPQRLFIDGPAPFRRGGGLRVRLEQIEQRHHQRVAQQKAAIGALARPQRLQGVLYARRGRAVRRRAGGVSGRAARPQRQAVVQPAQGRGQQKRRAPGLPQPGGKSRQRRKKGGGQRQAQGVDGAVVAESGRGAHGRKPEKRGGNKNGQ